LPRRDTKFLKQ